MNIRKDVNRIDKARITGSLTKTNDGYIKGTAVVARSGILEYHENGKTIRELVEPGELAKADSVETLKMKPLTNDHPSVRLLDPTTVRQFMVGHTGETVKTDGGVLATSLIIDDAKAIREVDGGKRELSCGYICDLLDEPGIWNGERYDRKQSNRRYNHVAICDLGRAGAVASLHLDSEDVYEVTTVEFDDKVEIKEEKKETRTDSQPYQRSDVMQVTIRIDGIDYPNQAPEVEKHITKLDAEIKASKDAAVAQKTVLDTKEAEITNLKAEIKTKNDSIAALPAQIAAAGKARAELVKAATPHLDKETVAKFDSMSDAEIKRVVAVKAFPQSAEKIKALKGDTADGVRDIGTWYDAAIEAVKDSRIDSVAAANRESANGNPESEDQHPQGCRCDECGSKGKSKEDAEKKVTQMYKNTNRDALLR